MRGRIAVIAAFVALTCVSLWVWASAAPAPPPPANPPSPVVATSGSPSATTPAPRRILPPTPTPARTTREAQRQPARSVSPPPVRQTDPDVVPPYRSCDDVRLDHPAGVERGHPAYRTVWDTDGDGWACDPPPE